MDYLENAILVDERKRTQKILQNLKPLFNNEFIKLKLSPAKSIDSVQISFSALGATIDCIVQFPPSYPLAAPKFFLLQIPVHPNIRATGEICYNLVQRDYRSDHTLESLILGLKCLLEEPNLDDYVNEEAAAIWRKKLNNL